MELDVFFILKNIFTVQQLIQNTVLKNNTWMMFTSFRRESYRVSQNLPQICTESAEVNMKHALKQMQYRFVVIYETLSIFDSVMCVEVARAYIKCFLFVF